jgi:eukaryotic-like serine/threonine-protein kinase
MPTEFHLLVQQILEAAVRLVPAEREVYIKQACAANADLLREVRSLLPHYEQVCDFEPRPPEGLTWNVSDSMTTLDLAAYEAENGADADPPPPFMLGRYTVVSVLGRGGMGVVYRALDATRPDVVVAIKLLGRGLMSPEDRWRFRFEEEVLHRLQHPGIARFITCDAVQTAHGPRPFFVMELVDGQALLAYAAANGLDALQRLALFVSVCEAVEHAHHRGIVHRDLKPDNILVERSGMPKVLDFGLAQFVASQPPAGEERPQFAGTLRYASPEQLQGRAARLTPRSDVFALGLICHELLTGELPASSAGELSLKLGGVRLDPPDAPRSLEEQEFVDGLASILGCALSKSENERYVSGGEFGAQLVALLLEYQPQGDRPLRVAWARLKARWARVFSASADSPASAASRPLSAVLRKRIAMAMEARNRPDAKPAGPVKPPPVPPEKPRGG